MKKFLVILLLISFLFQVTGYHLVFQYRKFDLKKTAKRMLRRRVDPALTEVFNFPLYSQDTTASPVWVDKHEFRFNGNMYDVIEKQVKGDRLIIRCLNDVKEKQLIDGYKTLAQYDFNQHSKKRSSMMLKLFNTFFTPTRSTGISAYRQVDEFNPDMRSIPLICSCLDVLTPPPQAA